MKFNNDKIIEQNDNLNNILLIREYDDESSESSSYDETSEEQTTDNNKNGFNKKCVFEKSATYCQIQKFIRYLKTGNPTATVITLSCLKDEDLHSELVRDSIKQNGGLEILINLLEIQDRKCKEAALLILRKISDSSYYIAKDITDLGAIPAIVRLLDEPFRNLKCLAAELISNVTRLQKARKIIRKTGGIKKLVPIEQLDVPGFVLSTNNTKEENLDALSLQIMDVLGACCSALWSVSQSKRNQIEICKFQVIQTFIRLLRFCQVDAITIPVLGVITHCASEKNFQTEIAKSGIIEDIVKYLSNKNELIKTHCAYVIFKCAENIAISNLIRQYGGLDPLVRLISCNNNEASRENQVVLSAAAGAIWKCAINPENLTRLDQLDIVSILIQLLNYDSEQVLTNVVGAISECTKLADCQSTIAKLDGIGALVNLLNSACELLLVNLCRVLVECAHDDDCIKQIVNYDGIRLLWSLLRSSSPTVQASSASALVSCIQNIQIQASAEMIRNFAGGLELLVSLLKSKDDEVVACTCATIAEVAKNPENLAIITDLNVVQYLARLVHLNSQSLAFYMSITFKPSGFERADMQF